MTMSIGSIELKKDRVESSSCCCKCFPSLIKMFRKKVSNKSSLENGPNFLDLLPFEIILEITEYLPVKDLVNFRTTARRYYQILSPSSSIWSRLCFRDFSDKVSVLKTEARSPYEIYKSETLVRKDHSLAVVDHYKFNSYYEANSQLSMVSIYAPPFFAGAFVYC